MTETTKSIIKKKVKAHIPKDWLKELRIIYRISLETINGIKRTGWINLAIITTIAAILAIFGSLFRTTLSMNSFVQELGNVLENFETKQELVDYFKKSTVLNKPDCEKCWAKYYCSGGCAANNFNCHGDILKPHEISCEMERKRIECAIALKALSLTDEE